MKLLISIIIILLIALVLGAHFYQTDNSVLIHYDSWTLQTSLLVAAIAILLTFFIIYALIRMIHSTVLWPGRIRVWGRKRKRVKMLEWSHLGLVNLIEEQWLESEQHLEKSAQLSPMPMVNYIGAAFAANQQKADERRDLYLQTLKEKLLLTEFHTILLRARLQIKADQWDEALITINRIIQQQPKNPQAFKLLIKIHQHQGHYDALYPLLTHINKLKILNPSEYQQLGKDTYHALMQAAGNAQDSERLTALWQELSTHEKSLLLKDYVKQLIRCQQDQPALVLIERALKQEWQPELLPVYANIKSQDLDKQHTKAEVWLKEHPECPELLECLGILSLRCQLWGKAKEYFTAAIALQPSAAAYYGLGQAAEALNDPSTALKEYRLGLQCGRNS